MTRAWPGLMFFGLSLLFLVVSDKLEGTVETWLLLFLDLMNEGGLKRGFFFFTSSASINIFFVSRFFLLVTVHKTELFTATELSGVHCKSTVNVNNNFQLCLLYIEL